MDSTSPHAPNHNPDQTSTTNSPVCCGPVVLPFSTTKTILAQLPPPPPPPGPGGTMSSAAASFFATSVSVPRTFHSRRAVSIPASSTRPRELPSVAPIRIKVRCNSAASNITEGYSSTPIDVVAGVKNERIVVLGGNGFVGSAICKAAVSKGIEVVSLNRSGRPSYSDYWVDQVTWIAGDVFYTKWDEILVGATAVISTLGGFGNNEQMERINGEANIVSVCAAKDFGVPKFVLISVHDYNLPSFLLSSGYFTGKRKAESEVLSKYPNSGVVLRPGFIYGKRKVDNYEIPLDLVGKPLERFLRATERFTKPLSSIPASDLLLAPPVSVDDVAFAAIDAVLDDNVFGVFTIEQIKEAAAKVRV